MDRYVVITGGPGSGKSTLVEHLRGQGYATRPEAGRAIMRDQVAIEGPGRPWLDFGLFAELMLSWDLRNHRSAAEESGPVVFDRGVVDVIGWLRLVGQPVPAHLHRAAEAFRYNRRVFAAPPWREIYTRDEERRQTAEEAERTYEAVTGAYADYGYDLVLLPKAPVEVRAAFVTERWPTRA